MGGYRGRRTGMRGLHSKGPGVNHLLRWVSETLYQACTAQHQYLGELKIHWQTAEDRGRETVKEGNGKKSRRANGTKGMYREMGLDDAKVGKRIQRAQSRFTESHYLPQITWTTSLK